MVSVFLSLRMLSLVVKSVPGIIIVRREHVPRLHTAGEVVMAVEVPVAVDLNEPGSTAGATGHIARDGDHGASPMLPAFAGGPLAGLPGLPIECIRTATPIRVDGLTASPTIRPTPPPPSPRQHTLAP